MDTLSALEPEARWWIENEKGVGRLNKEDREQGRERTPSPPLDESPYRFLGRV